jgi:hypothetical protein
LIVVPRGLEHRPVAEEEAHIPLFEPASTLNMGNARDQRILEKLERIYEPAARASQAFKNLCCGPDMSKPWRITQNLKCLRRWRRLERVIGEKCDVA